MVWHEWQLAIENNSYGFHLTSDILFICQTGLIIHYSTHITDYFSYVDLGNKVFLDQDI